VNGGWSCNDGEDDWQGQDGYGMEAESVVIGSSQSGWKADRCLKERRCCDTTKKNKNIHTSMLTCWLMSRKTHGSMYKGSTLLLVVTQESANKG
jgi:hypothetical protein